MSLRRTAFWLAALALLPTAARAATVPVGFQDRIVASGLTSPSAMTVLPDGRVLVTQQNGHLRLIKNDALVSGDFYVVSGIDFTYERGLLGVVADPGFATNRYLYLFYTANAPSSHNRILRVTVSGDSVVAGSEHVVLELPNIPSGVKWHMGGAMRFGPDGKLYVGVGNQEDSRRSDSNSGKLTNPFGKILRINSDGTFPTDNPFYNVAGAYRGIWAYGLRNPFTFDISGDGTVFINDVGDATWEEINRGAPGANFGWPVAEGNSSDTRFVNPFYTYVQSPECAVLGAAFYEPAVPQFPAAYTGKFLFGDFCAGWIKRIDPVTKAITPFVTGLTRLVNIGISADGSLYYLDRNQHTGTPTPGKGTVGKITYTGSQAPRITQHPEDLTVYVGESARFTVTALDATSYQWQRNGADITGATSTSYTLGAAAASDDGARFRALVRNSFGTATSSEAILTVTTNKAPTATIVTPPAGATCEAGEEIGFSGTGSDPEDGTLPPSAFTWQVDILHDTHQHPFMPQTTGISSGSFIVSEDHGGIANIWYRMYLSVEDSGARMHTAFRDIRPRTSVSDMTWIGTPTNGWGPIEKDMSVGGQAGGDGKTITLDGIPYGKGLGAHAPSEVRYALGGTCSGTFIADVGVDDEVAAGLGSVVFQVWLDGVKAYDSGIVHRNDARKAVNVSVAGKGELRLVVTDAGDGKGSDHADWAGARVTGCGGAATPTPTPTPTVPGPTPTPTPTIPSSGLVEITPPASAVTASTNDGNLPGNTVDNNLGTRWSGNGDGAWIQYDLGTTRTIAEVRIAVYNGNGRHNRFDLEVSNDLATWTNVWSGETSGTTTNEEPYDIADVDARWLRYVGHSSDVGTFNSVTEVSLFAPSVAGPTPTPSPTPTPTATPTPNTTPIDLTPGAGSVTASTNDGNVPGNTVDNNLGTRWSGSGDGQWIQYDLGASHTVTSVSVAWYQGNTRVSTFDVQVGGTPTGPWTTALAGAQSNGTGTALEAHDVSDTAGRYVRIVGHGNTLNTWNSITEVEIWGQ